MDDQDSRSSRSRLRETRDGLDGNGRGQTLTLRGLLASILIVVGFVIACWTAYMVRAAIQEPDALPLYRVIASEIAGFQVKTSEGESGGESGVVLTGKFMGAMAIFLLLIVSAAISATLITQGAHLMNLDMLRLLRKFDSLKRHLGRKFVALNASAKRK